MGQLNNVPQYSIRALLQITTVIALLLGVAIGSWNTDRLDAIFPLSLVIAVSPVAIVWLLHRFEVLQSGALAIGSLLLFGASLCSPAVKVDARALLPGWSAFVSSFMGLLMWGEATHTWPRFWALFAYVFGAGANIAFIVGYVALVRSLLGANTIDLANKSGRYGTILAMAVTLPLAAAGIRDFYPGYGLWTASLLALWLDTRRYVD